MELEEEEKKRLGKLSCSSSGGNRWISTNSCINGGDCLATAAGIQLSPSSTGSLLVDYCSLTIIIITLVLLQFHILLVD